MKTKTKITITAISAAIIVCLLSLILAPTYVLGVYGVGGVGMPPFKLEKINTPYLSADLGSHKAKIPREYLGLLEFDKNISQALPGLPKITSFGYHFRTSDGKISKAFDIVSFAKETPTTSSWVSIGIDGHRSCPECYKLTVDKLIASSNFSYGEAYKPANFKLINGKKYGLSILETTRPPDHARSIFKPDRVYFKTNANGLVTTKITCTDSGRVPRCRHRLSLYPEIEIYLTFHYRLEYLAKWQKFEESNKKIINSFIENK